jgi:hypothetical protein
MDDLLPIDESEIRALLEGRKGDWQAIARDASVSHSWLSKFVNGHIDGKHGPGIYTLRRVRAAIAANDERKARA